MAADGGNDRSSLCRSASDLKRQTGTARPDPDTIVRPSGRPNKAGTHGPHDCPGPSGGIGWWIRQPLAICLVSWDLTALSSGSLARVMLLPHLTLPNRARPGLFAGFDLIALCFLYRRMENYERRQQVDRSKHLSMPNWQAMLSVRLRWRHTNNMWAGTSRAELFCFKNNSCSCSNILARKRQPINIILYDYLLQLIPVTVSLVQFTLS